MFGFLIKKTFFDFWDNFLSIAILNLGFVLFAPLAYLVYIFIDFNFLIFIILLFIWLFCFNLYLGIAAMAAGDIAFHLKIDFKKVFSFGQEIITHVLLLTVIMLLMIMVVVFIFPFYLRFNHFISTIALVFLFWFTISCFLAIQYFYPVRKQLTDKNMKILKKCFILYLDNLFFTINIAISAFLIFCFSVLLVFLFPGFVGVLILYQNALKLRLYKYDYLEKKPETDKKHIPWYDLLGEERKKIGSRSFRSIIFPWKD
ncbi:MAG: hypothetical protein MJB14_13565 [Spirochaetes bacterium]|nr:hypothetical protein [Spirochaetota bacterium]